MMRKIKIFGLLSALLAMVIAAGCSVVTGTFIISIKIDSYDINEDKEDFAYFSVDLSQEEDWNKHKDDIKNIDNVGFQLWFNNTGDETVTGEIYASTMDTVYNDTAAVKGNATLIFSGLEIPPGVSYVDWPTSLGYIHNLPTLRRIVETGLFTGYALTTTLPFTVTLDSATVIITLTAAP
jgi:hypothetical protein